MFRCVYLVSAVLLSVVFTCPQAASAEPLPFVQTAALGRPARPVRVAVQGRSAVTLDVAGKRRLLPMRSASEITMEVVQVAPDAAVAVLRVLTEEGPWVGLLGGRSGSELLLLEPSGPVGDPGERRTRVLTVRGEPREVRTGVRHEGVSLCGDREALLSPQQLDPETLTLRPAPPAHALGKIVDVPVQGGAGRPPALSALAAVASSELDPTTELARVPRALVGGDPGRAVDAHPGSFVLLRWEGRPLPIERLELDLVVKGRAPVALLWLGDGESVLRTEVGPEARTIAIVPPAPLGGSCLALLIAPENETPGVALRALRAYSALDREGGVEALIGALVQDDREGAEAADLLAKLGPDAAERLAARWDVLSPRGKRRGLRVLGRALGQAQVRKRVVDTARADDPTLRQAALALLREGGEPGLHALRELAQEASPAGDDAARLLALRPGEAPTLLAALARAGGEERVVLRTALGSIARREPARFGAESAAWLAREPRVGALAALALAAAEAGERALPAHLAEAHAARAESFADRYRFALALRDAAASPGADAWLTQQVEHAAEWMQRRAAFDALAARGAASVPALAQKLARDDYPRLRASAYPSLIAAGELRAVESASREDEWPLVRAAAVQALALAPDARPALERALDDRAAGVRHAAVEALTQQAHAAAWPRIEPHLRSEAEARSVREAAVGFAGKLCIMQAQEALVHVASALLAPEASEDAGRLAVEALRALHALGGEAAEGGARLVAKVGTPALHRLWSGLPRSRCADVRPES